MTINLKEMWVCNTRTFLVFTCSNLFHPIIVRFTGFLFKTNGTIGLESRVGMFFTSETSETSEKSLQRDLDSPILWLG